jgi:DNA-binding transcriptional LysR family regulator
MDLELRQLRCLVAIADAGTFTDAGLELGVSQAAVSRGLQSLEAVLGVRLLHRTSRTVTPTRAGVRVLAQARQLLAAADNLVTAASAGHTVLRVGHAWSALGRHTRPFLRRWAVEQPAVDLELIRVNTPSGGLDEGRSDIAVLRTGVDDARYGSAVVGRERRFCVLPADDPWATRRSVRLSEVAGRTVVADRHTGTTTASLWPPEARPRLRYTRDVDDWLAVITAGSAVGITPEATAAQYRRPGVVFRPLRDAPPVEVRVAWRRADPHPATEAAVTLLTELYQRRPRG